MSLPGCELEVTFATQQKHSDCFQLDTSMGKPSNVKRQSGPCAQFRESDTIWHSTLTGRDRAEARLLSGGLKPAPTKSPARSKGSLHRLSGSGHCNGVALEEHVGGVTATCF